MKGRIKMSGKRLYRVKQGAMLAGVCQGIADYLKIDGNDHSIRMGHAKYFFIRLSDDYLIYCVSFYHPLRRKHNLL